MGRSFGRESQYGALFSKSVRRLETTFPPIMVLAMEDSVGD
jgi:hypothetical protein